MIINHVKSLLIGTLSLFIVTANAAEKDDFPKRIIALSPHAVEMLYAIGAGEHIVATITHADYPEQAKAIEVIGDYRGITLEKLISLKPDLVVTWPSGNKFNQIEQIKKLGFNVVASDPTNLDEIASDIRHLGKVIGYEVRANQVADQFEQELAVITKRYQSRTPVKVFYQLWSKPLMTISKDSWINQFITRCGGINVFSDADSPYPKVSTENVLLTGAQVILVPEDKETRGHELYNWQQWQLLPAVKNKQIYHPDAKVLHRPTPRVLTPMKQVCEFIDKARQSL